MVKGFRGGFACVSVCVRAYVCVGEGVVGGGVDEGEVLMFMPLTYLCNSSNGVGKLLQ